MLKIKELLEKQYNSLKEEYQLTCDRLPIAIKEQQDEYEKIRKENYDTLDIHFNKAPYSLINKYKILESEIATRQSNKPILLKKLNKINEILNNDAHIISLKRNELEKFSKGKIILEVGTSAIGNSNSNIKGKIDGGINGSSVLGFGGINGSINGYIDGKTSSHYEEYILVKYKYNLDYQIEEFLFDINDYLNIKGDSNER